MNRSTWLISWLKPQNLIALALLFVTAFGVFAGIKFFSKTQEITGEEGCLIDNATQSSSGNANSSQKINCSDSVMKNLKLEQLK